MLSEGSIHNNGDKIHVPLKASLSRLINGCLYVLIHRLTSKFGYSKKEVSVTTKIMCNTTRKVFSIFPVTREELSVAQVR